MTNYVYTFRHVSLCVIYSAHVCYLTLYVARFVAPLTVIITVGTSAKTDQSTTTIHATTKVWSLRIYKRASSARHKSEHIPQERPPSDYHRQRSDPQATRDSFRPSNYQFIPKETLLNP